MLYKLSCLFRFPHTTSHHSLTTAHDEAPFTHLAPACSNITGSAACNVHLNLFKGAQAPLLHATPPCIHRHTAIS